MIRLGSGCALPALVLIATAVRLPWGASGWPIEAQEPAAESSAAAPQPEGAEPEPAAEAAIPGPMDLFIAYSRAQLIVQGFAKHQAEVAGQPFAWWEKGDGPPLVLLHGVTSQAGGWFQIAPGLAGGHRVLLPDLPGHGESGPADGPLEMSTVLAGLEGWLEAQVLAGSSESSPPVLVGNSMGAWLAVLVAERHPQWVSRLVLINGGPLRFDAGDLDLLPADREEARRLMAALRDPSNPATPDAVLDDLVRRAEDGQVARMLAAGDDLERYFLDGRLDQVGTPVDVLWGESDRYMGRQYPDRLLAELPAARLTLLPKCGHVPQVECPAALAEALSEVLGAEPPSPGTTPDGAGREAAGAASARELGGDADGVGHYLAKTNTGKILLNMLTSGCTGTACCSGYGDVCGN